jgi:nucleotide-binding universal stress UspA family protein
MKRILVASDLSPCSTNALARAIGLAAQSGAAIRIVHAAVDEEELYAREALHRKIATEARIMAEALTDRSLDFTVRVSSAGPGHAIVGEAEIFGADLVILGAHGEPRFRDAIFGTTGTYVVRHCDCPILVVQNDAREPYAKTLIAIDDVEGAPAILANALGVAPAAELFAVHAFSPTLGQMLGGGDEVGRQETRQELEIEKILGAALAGRTPAKVSAERHGIVETGEALEVIMRETTELAPDLLVMGTRRRATFLTSHAVDTLFWCPHDLLVVPERESVAPAAPVDA